MWPDVLVAALLLLIVCAVFREAIFTEGAVPAGQDLLQHYARESVLRLVLAAGAPPYWSPYEFSGFPLQAEPHSGVFYPPNVGLRVLPLASFFTWTAILHVWLFGVGSYVLCRVMHIGRPAAVVAALGLMLGGITVPRVSAGHVDFLRTVAWLPLAAAVTFRSLDRARGVPSPLVVGVMACQVLGNNPQAITYTFACITLYAAFSICWPPESARSWRHAQAIGKELAWLVILVIGVTAFQLLPSARLVWAGARVSGVAYDDAAMPAFGLDEFTRFLTPSFVQQAAAPEAWETSAYIGLLLTALAPMALWVQSQRRTVSFLTLLAVVTCAFASGGPLYKLHYALFPMFRIPGRLLALFAVAIAVLGAIGLERLVAGGEQIVTRRVSRRYRIVAFTLAAALVIADGFSYARRYVQVRLLEDRFLRTVPFTPSRGGRVLSLCESRAHPLELAALGIPSVDGYNPYFLSDYARLVRFARRESVDTKSPLAPRIGALETLPEMDVIDLLNVTEILSCKPLEDAQLRPMAERDPLRVYRNLGAAGRVRPVVLDSRGCDGVDQVLERSETSQDARVHSLIADEADGRLRFVISSTRPHMLFLAEPYYPERRAWIDGAEVAVRKANVALSAVCVAGGEHVVEIRYVPSSLMLGAGITTVTLLAWMAVPFVRRRRGGRPSE